MNEKIKVVDKTKAEDTTICMNDFFKSEEHKIIFAVLYTDTVLREKLLGISEELYLETSKAKEWRNYIAKKIHPDACSIPGAEEAMKKINELYTRMTESDDGDGQV